MIRPQACESVRESKNWRTKKILPEKRLKKEDIEDVFKNANFAENAVSLHTELTNRAISLVGNNSFCPRKLYTGRNVSYVAFYNDHYYIDGYGNCYLNENDFLQTWYYFTGQGIFDSHNYNFTKLPTDVEVIQIISNSLESLEKCKAFSAFKNDCSTAEIISVLQSLKSHFLFFCALDDVIIKHNIQATFAVDSNVFSILFSNLRYININFKNEEDYLKMLSKTCLAGDMKELPFDTCMMHLGLTNYICTLKGKAEFDILKKETKKRWRFDNFSYRNLCFFIAIKIFKYMQIQPELSLKCTKVTHFQFLFFWVDARFRRHARAKKEFESNEIAIKKEYCALLKLIQNKSNYSRRHWFNNSFTAAYHFQEHYTAIAQILTRTLNVTPAYPALTIFTLNYCVQSYLIRLAEYMFDDGFFDYEKDKDPSPFKTQLRQNYNFSKYDGMIKGIKYKFVDHPDIKGDKRINVKTVNLAGTQISTIFEDVSI